MELKEKLFIEKNYSVGRDDMDYCPVCGEESNDGICTNCCEGTIKNDVPRGIEFFGNFEEFKKHEENELINF